MGKWDTMKILKPVATQLSRISLSADRHTHTWEQLTKAQCLIWLYTHYYSDVLYFFVILGVRICLVPHHVPECLCVLWWVCRACAAGLVGTQWQRTVQNWIEDESETVIVSVTPVSERECKLTFLSVTNMYVRTYIHTCWEQIPHSEPRANALGN